MNHRGFTLIEILVVLLILALVGSVAIPRLATRATGAEAVAERVAAVLVAARAHAVDRGIRTGVLLDATSGRWVVLGTPGTWGGGDTVRTGLLSLDGTALGSGQADRVQVTFDAVGRAWGAPIDVRGADHRYTIRVHPWTGAVDVSAH